MALTYEKSDLCTNTDAVPVVMNDPSKGGSVAKPIVFSFTQGAAAGDANSLAYLCDVPPGVRVLMQDSFVKTSAFGAARTLDIGFVGYTKTDGTAVTGVADKFLDGADVSAGGTFVLGVGTNAEPISHMFDSGVKEGAIRLVAKCLVDTLPAGATIKGIIWIVV
jgi:hypothetical protein